MKLLLLLQLYVEETVEKLHKCITTYQKVNNCIEQSKVKKPAEERNENQFKHEHNPIIYFNAHSMFIVYPSYISMPNILIHFIFVFFFQKGHLVIYSHSNGYKNFHSHICGFDLSGLNAFIFAFLRFQVLEICYRNDILCSQFTVPDTVTEHKEKKKKRKKLLKWCVDDVCEFRRQHNRLDALWHGFPTSGEKVSKNVSQNFISIAKVLITMF